MSTSISFKCIHCKQEIDADSEFAGQEVKCPGCAKSIIVPKQDSAANEREVLLEKYSNLQNLTEQEMKSSLSFLKEYSDSKCKNDLSEEENMHILSIAFKNGIGPAIVKRYETALFACSMQGSNNKDQKKFQEALFCNKKLNKQLKEIVSGTGVELKKKGFLGLFG